MIDYARYRQDFIEGKRFIYIMTRLYDFVEKIRGSMLETATIRGVKRAMSDLGVKMSYFPTFLPFRDTREDEVISEERTKIIYDLDMQRLERLFGIVGSLDGPSKDDGICMELGYAFAKGIPTIVLVNDFIWYASRAVDGLEFVLDPVLLRIIGKLIYENNLPPSKTRHEDMLFSNMMRVKRDYFTRARLALQNSMRTIAHEVHQMILRPEEYVSSLPDPTRLDSVSIYLDFEGGKHEWQRVCMNRLSRLFKEHGYLVRQSLRHNPRHQKEISDKYGERASMMLGEIDIKHALGASIIVTCGDGPEVDSGTAAIQGIARALGKRLIMYYSGNVESRGEGGHKMIRNLMLQYSADLVVDRLRRIPETIDALVEGVGN